MIQYIGMDVHKEKISVCVLKGIEKEPEMEVVFDNRRKAIKTFFDKRKKDGKILCCYEAGCLGSALYRYLTEMKVDCWVIAPNKIPTRTGDRVKTDKRDAYKLAKLLRSGELEPINVLSGKDEAVRDFIRARADFVNILKRFKNMLTKFLLRSGFSYEDKYWTQKHKAWMNALKFEFEAQRMTYEMYITKIEELENDIRRFNREIELMANEPEYVEQVKKLCTFKGVETLTAMSLICEIGDFKRFKTAPQFMSYLGLVPSEFSSGDTRKQGHITKTGNKYLRSLLIQVAWQYQYKNMYSQRMREKQKGKSDEMIKYAVKAGVHLNEKFRRLVARGKKSTKAITAIARDFSGFVWGSMTNNMH